MRSYALRFFASALLAGAVWAQPAAQPAFYNTAICTKTPPGADAAQRSRYFSDLGKLMKSRVEAGEAVSWSLMRSVIPAGEDARCDYVSLTTYQGTPGKPATREDLIKGIERSGLKISPDEYYTRRAGVSKLVSIEMWRPLISIGQAAKGNYLYVNFMKVHKMADYVKFESEVWQPMAAQWIKEKAMTSWNFSLAMLPGGTDVKYAALSVDVFPDWESAFKRRSLTAMFKKVHAGKSTDQIESMDKLRDLARREMYVIEERFSSRK
jgi:hypothetical protein